MDTPFFRSNWNQPSRPRYSPSFGGIPVQSSQRKTTSSSPKVVSIPVHFVVSETTRSAAVLKIQKFFRGYLVRKSVKRIVSIEREVDDIKQRISQSETVHLIRRDAKERLRVNETLMALLFKLDSVRGIDSGVRDCRKTVIRKAIALQERVDAIVAGDETLGTVADVESNDNQASHVDDFDAEDQNLEIEHSADSERAVDQSVEMDSKASDVDVPAYESVENPTPEIKISVNCSTNSNNTVNQTLEIEGKTPGPANVLIDDNADKYVSEDLSLRCPGVRGLSWGKSEATPEAENESLNLQFSDGIVESSPNCEKMDITDVGVDSEVNANEEACVVKEIVENHITTPGLCESINESVETSPTGNQSDYSVNPESLIEGGEDNNTSKLEEDRIQVPQAEQTEGDLKDCVGAGERAENKRNRELLERMMEDSEKMMNMMTQLFERNETQTRMLSSLTLRVEQLERAFMCKRLRRKKKRRAVGTVDGLETTADQRKCGKR